MLEETPPGQQPTNMRPTVRAGLRPKALETVKAISGIRVYCATVPIRISWGLLAKILKSLTVSVMPIVSMIKPRMTVWVSPCTNEKRSGVK